MREGRQAAQAKDKGKNAPVNASPTMGMQGSQKPEGLKRMARTQGAQELVIELHTELVAAQTSQAGPAANRQQARTERGGGEARIAEDAAAREPRHSRLATEAPHLGGWQEEERSPKHSDGTHDPEEEKTVGGSLHDGRC